MLDKVIDMTEQWLLDGNCELCRKSKYCGTPCRKKKVREKETKIATLRNELTNLMQEVAQRAENTKQEDNING